MSSSIGGNEKPIGEYTPEVSLRYGRCFKDGETRLYLNDIVKKTYKQKDNLTKSERNNFLKDIRQLDQKGEDLLTNEKNIFITACIYLRRLFTGLFFNREKILNKLEFGEEAVPVTSKGRYRILKLQGENGEIDCKVRGLAAHTFPRISEGKTFEFFYRAYARLRNLTAFRGTEDGSRMQGPLDYFGNLENPHKYNYTINIDDEGLPTFLRHNLETSPANQPIEIKQPPPSSILKVKWSSDSGNERESPKFGASIFPKRGILEVYSETETLNLSSFDATKYDLAPFKARLVKNDVPFSITKEKLPGVDEYRAITYNFENNYADMQVNDGVGQSLETHAFAQTITPLSKECSGFVTLARWSDKWKDLKDQEKPNLEVIGVKIPFGFTLIIDPYSIHGDTDLKGKFLMCMTSNHETMKEADPVFLKKANDKQKNVRLTNE